MTPAPTASALKRFPVSVEDMAKACSRGALKTLADEAHAIQKQGGAPAARRNEIRVVIGAVSPGSGAQRATVSVALPMLGGEYEDRASPSGAVPRSQSRVADTVGHEAADGDETDDSVTGVPASRSPLGHADLRTTISRDVPARDRA